MNQLQKTYNIKNTPLEFVVNMAADLQKPLIVSGKPGTGKTQLAFSYKEQNEKGYNNIYKFNTKSNTVFSDLLYVYDTVSHFRNQDTTKTVADFIALNALGKAIVLAKGINSDLFKTENWQKIISKSISEEEKKHSKSIVLIDEVDKAPRDFPNDLLNELDNFEFDIKELGTTIKIDDQDKAKLLLIITSNEEKNLPDPFLRRCLFHYIDFPNQDQMREIILSKMPNLNVDALNNKLYFFYSLCDDKIMLDKKPATSECIDWINWLHNNNMLDKDPKDIQQSLSTLLKKSTDLKLVKGLLEKM